MGASQGYFVPRANQELEVIGPLLDWLPLGCLLDSGHPKHQASPWTWEQIGDWVGTELTPVRGLYAQNTANPSWKPVHGG